MAAAVQDDGINPWRTFASDFAEKKLAVLGLIVFVALIAAAIFAPWITPQNPYDLNQIDFLDGRLEPGSVGSQITYWLGTDDQGRDLLSGIFYGLRTSLAVGAASTLIALVLGGALGLFAAYFGGRVDTLIMRIADLQLSFPAILIALILVSALGQGVDKVIISLVAVQWAYYARTIRGTALVERRKEYVEAATCLAISHRRIVFKHLMPNCTPPLIVVGTVQVAHAISLEATLSFLGIGVPITEPSLGLLIKNGFDYMLSGDYWVSFYPGLALLITIVSINLVGDQLRDVLNPRLKK
ncbi:ABC transporter permease [Sneathiella chinensis]|uniref:Peptide ABC transporter permease n=1 Tax=Sneathiella chinensis TaxID=349750 RepID=A0ABQ5U4R1_9PROT|nr:ABC transporter permease [Sneathiella chinensis]GLQ06899.1 peptide ABC transporter permease [Sneathiella chinensis]